MAFGNIARLADFRPADPEAVEVPTADGGVIIQFGPARNDPSPITDDEDPESFYRNLADEVDASVLGRLAWEVLDGIEADNTSRTQWISDRTRGLDLLAIKIEGPRADLGGSAAPMEGMATVRHPLLLEACIQFQSNFKREMLPANGPVKVKNAGQQVQAADAQAEKLGDLMNRYCTEFAPEYYPDTDRMSFDLGFSGTSFKKVFHCPLRRRPASDTVPGKDLIVSNDATDLRTAQRVTQVIQMTRATMARMQYVGAYRNVPLQAPDQETTNSVTQKQKNLQGLAATPTRPQDQQYQIYECHTFLDLDGFEHVDDDTGEATGLPLPYVVTVDKQSRQILEIRRDWDMDAGGTFERRRTFIAYHFVPMFGFYATGLLHILGNTTTAVTAAWRILLDNGMFSNFPGFLYGKNGARQDDLNLRVPPGGGAGVDLSGADDIRKTIMPLPYNTQNAAALMQLTDNIAQTGARVGGTATMIDPAGVKSNMPVGTMMAIVEQAAQTISAVHERCFVSQSHEFQELLIRFREDPESLWRYIKDDGTWTYEELVQTLETYTLVPVADPNTPTHVHRIMKMTVLKQLEQANPERYNGRAVDERILRAIKIDDPETLFAPPAPPQALPPDPAVIIAEATKQTKLADIQSRERIEQMKAQLAAQKEAAAREIEGAKLQIKQLELELKRALAAQAEETKLAAVDVQAETADKDRASKEHIAVMQLAESVAHSPYDDDNHAKALELKKAGPPKPANGAPKKT